MIALLATALAHHGTATTQVAPTVGGSAAGQEASVSLGVSSLGFLRTYRGSQRAPDVGRVGVHLATLQTRVPLGRGWSLGASVPVGLIATTGAVRGGLGDASASLGRAGERLAGALTLSAPTGGRVQHPELSVTDVRGTDDGQLLLTTYDTRASLGQGAPTVGLRTDARLPGIDLGASASTPWTRTSDGILWGPTGQVWAGGRLDRDAHAVWIGLLGTAHGRDRATVLDEDTGELVAMRTGARAEVAVRAGGQVRLGPSDTVRADLGAPVWRWVQGVQLAAGPRASLTWERALGPRG